MNGRSEKWVLELKHEEGLPSIRSQRRWREEKGKAEKTWMEEVRKRYETEEKSGRTRGKRAKMGKSGNNYGGETHEILCKNGRRKTPEKYTKQKKTENEMEKAEKNVDGRSEK